MHTHFKTVLNEAAMMLIQPDQQRLTRPKSEDRLAVIVPCKVFSMPEHQDENFYDMLERQNYWSV